MKLMKSVNSKDLSRGLCSQFANTVAVCDEQMSGQKIDVCSSIQLGIADVR